MSPASKHTPGPWVRFVLNGRQEIASKNEHGKSVAVVPSGPDRDANARLIASAPSLLAERDALRKALADLVQAQDDIDEGRVHDCILRSDAIDRARAALALGGASA